jgi:hypothetical protein
MRTRSSLSFTCGGATHVPTPLLRLFRKFLLKSYDLGLKLILVAVHNTTQGYEGIYLSILIRRSLETVPRKLEASRPPKNQPAASLTKDEQHWSVIDLTDPAQKIGMLRPLLP